MMRLVIETAGFSCSVALLDGTMVMESRHEVLRRGHAERLIPMLAELPDGGRANRIIVGCGPGSFTGVRVGIAAARALGLAWQVPVEGVGSLALVAAGHFAARPTDARVAVVMEGGHGELFVQSFQRGSDAADAPPRALAPALAAEATAGWPLAGNAAEALSGFAAAMFDADASACRWLPEHWQFSAPSPAYGRAPDARPLAHPA